MSKTFKPYSREQQFLLPPSLQEWLPEGHLAYFIIEVVEGLDLSDVFRAYTGKDGRGHPPYDPRVMVALLLYAYCVGVPSSRQIEKRTYEDLAFRVVSANQHPDHDSICEFRKRHLEALGRLFLQVLKICQRAGLVKLGQVALDGTKVRANASKHKAMSYGRMKKAEDDLQRQILELFEKAEATDSDEDRRHGKGERGWDLVGEFRRRDTRLRKIREAMAALEEEARTEAVLKAKEREQTASDQDDEPKPRGRRPSDPGQAKPKDRTQRNFTDPESRIMKCGSTGSFEQCYNAQAAVDSAFQVIVAVEVTDQANDKQQVAPMVESMACTLAEIPTGMDILADAGYFSENNVLVLEEFGLNPHVATGKVKHGEKPVAVRGRPPKDMSVRQRMARKLATKAGHEVYARRKVIVEPVFGQMKRVRGLGQFLLRGLKNVAAEWKLWCLTHNLLKLYRYGSLEPA
jgi:transposase